MDKREELRKKLVSLVKAAGQEVINRAEDLVGDAELMTDFEINLSFPQPLTPHDPPVIEASREYHSCERMEILIPGFKKIMKGE